MNKLSKTLGAMTLSLIGGCENATNDRGDIEQLNQVVQKATIERQKIDGEVHKILNSDELIDAEAHFQLMDEEAEKAKKGENKAQESPKDLLDDPANLVERLEARKEVDKLWDK